MPISLSAISWLALCAGMMASVGGGVAGVCASVDWVAPWSVGVVPACGAGCCAPPVDWSVDCAHAPTASIDRIAVDVSRCFNISHLHTNSRAASRLRDRASCTRSILVADGCSRGMDSDSGSEFHAATKALRHNDFSAPSYWPLDAGITNLSQTVTMPLSGARSE